MRFPVWCLLLAGLLLSSYLEGNAQRANPDLMVRLSYRGEIPTCVSVSSTGEYRLSRTSGFEVRIAQGQLPEAKLRQLKRLLANPDLRDLPGSQGGLLTEFSDSFGAEIFRQDGTQRLQWLNADGDKPFPPTVLKIIDWIENFNPPNDFATEDTEFGAVCPSYGFRLLKPEVASR